ncbi:MAG: GNAT family N-acetyltransferase [Acidimicrobiales bacterium]
MPVRVANPSDIDEIAAMVHEHAAFEGAADRCQFDLEAALKAMSGPGTMLHGLIASPADDPAKLAGFALWYPTFSSWAGTSGIWLEDLYVRPAFRRQGLGRELLSELRRTTSGRIEWEVLATNTDAQSFYRRLGATRHDGWLCFRWTP